MCFLPIWFHLLKKSLVENFIFCVVEIFFWEAIVIFISYLVHYYTLLQNATDGFTKCDSFFIKKCEMRMQNASGFLLQNATVSLQIATVITRFDLCHKISRKMLSMLFECLNVKTLFWNLRHVSCDMQHIHKAYFYRITVFYILRLILG